MEFSLVGMNCLNRVLPTVSTLDWPLGRSQPSQEEKNH